METTPISQWVVDGRLHLLKERIEKVLNTFSGRDRPNLNESHVKTILITLLTGDAELKIDSEARVEHATNKSGRGYTDLVVSFVREDVKHIVIIEIKAFFRGRVESASKVVFWGKISQDFYERNLKGSNIFESPRDYQYMIHTSDVSKNVLKVSTDAIIKLAKRQVLSYSFVEQPNENCKIHRWIVICVENIAIVQCV